MPDVHILGDVSVLGSIDSRLRCPFGNGRPTFDETSRVSSWSAVLCTLKSLYYVYLTPSHRTLPEITHRVYFTIEVDGEEQEEKIVFGLFGTATPKTVENFVALVNCDHGVGKKSGKPLCYKGTPIHRIVPGFGFSGEFT